ncbi:aminoglycoside phosphotransferase family protein [Halioxenophilus aromaticivorans]|uniref:Phosphotransferase n=1 Tax=Halioxenophilus aromaticivorans TaxID=1306992 RepID=A0AAV3U9R3_9ALTE
MNASQHTNLTQWVNQQLQALGATEPCTLAALSGDAGFRQYLRVDNGPRPMLAVLAPPESENNPLFVALAIALRKGHLCTPEVFAADFERGYLLVEDFGDQLLWCSLQQQPINADCLYGQALISLLSLQQEQPYHIDLPSYGPQMLLREMNLFNHWFVGELLGLDEQLGHDTLAPIYNQLVANALAQPQVLVHRDFHSRNLLERPGLPLGVIDFQGAVWGPITYDVVSLLKDCYLQWPRAKVEGWALSYSELAKDTGLLAEVDNATFLRWFDWTGLQRHIKVLGIFARLALRDNKPNYLQDLPLVVHYVRDCASRYSALQPLADLFDQQLMPVVEAQSWYQPVVAAQI